MKAFWCIRCRLLFEVKLHKATCVNRLHKLFRPIASVRQNALKAFGRTVAIALFAIHNPDHHPDRPAQRIGSNGFATLHVITSNHRFHDAAKPHVTFGCCHQSTLQVPIRACRHYNHRIFFHTACQHCKMP